MGATHAVTAIWPAMDVLRPSFRVRSLTKGDASGLIAFRCALSADTVYNRYFAPVRLSHDELRMWAEGLLSGHPCRRLTWVATNASHGVIGVLELAPHPGDRRRGEMGVVVADRYQRRGVGKALGQYALKAARRLGMWEVHACMLAENRSAQRYVRGLGPPCVWEDDGELRSALLSLRS